MSPFGLIGLAGVYLTGQELWQTARREALD
jgi:hypothetical protein